MEITLKDVELAVKILNEFMNQQKRATMILRRFLAEDTKGSRFPTSMQDIMSMALDTVQARQNQRQNQIDQNLEDIEPTELTDEDMKRFEEIKKRIKDNQ